MPFGLNNISLYILCRVRFIAENFFHTVDFYRQKIVMSLVVLKIWACYE